MWYDDDYSPSCGNTQCQPLPPQALRQFSAPQGPPPPPPAATAAVPYSSGGAPPDPLSVVQGVVVQQDVLRPPSEVYGEGAVYELPGSHASAPACSAACSSCYSPREHERRDESCRPAPVALSTVPQLHRRTQVVRYGQASSDNPNSYMLAEFTPLATAPPAPGVGMVSLNGGQTAGAPPVACGSTAAPGAPAYTLSGTGRSSYGSAVLSAAPSGEFPTPNSSPWQRQQASNGGSGGTAGHAPYSAAPPCPSYPSR